MNPLRYAPCLMSYSRYHSVPHFWGTAYLLLTSIHLVLDFTLAYCFHPITYGFDLFMKEASNTFFYGRHYSLIGSTLITHLRH